MLETLTQKQFLPISRAEAWEFFSTPRNLDEITPDNLGFEIVSCPDGKMYEGQIITYRVEIMPLVRIPWVTEIKAIEEGVAFVDEQRFGPYKFWHHRHSFEDAEGGVLMRDVVNWAVPFEPLSWPVKQFFVRPKVEGIFSYRRKLLEDRFGKGD